MDITSLSSKLTADIHQVLLWYELYECNRNLFLIELANEECVWTPEISVSINFSMLVIRNMIPWITETGIICLYLRKYRTLLFKNQADYIQFKLRWF